MSPGMATRQAKLFSEQRGLFDVTPSADLQAPADPAETLGLCCSALGAANLAGKGLQRSRFEDDLLRRPQYLGVDDNFFIDRP